MCWTLWQEETAQAVTTPPPPNPVCFFTTHWLLPHPPRLSWEQSQQSSKLKQQLTLYTVDVWMDVCTAWKRPCGFRRRQVRVLWRQLRRLQEGYFQQNLHRLKSVLSSYFTQCTYTFYAKTKNDMRQQKNKKNDRGHFINIPYFHLSGHCMDVSFTLSAGALLVNIPLHTAHIKFFLSRFMTSE